jgi:hypothetical protein
MTLLLQIQTQAPVQSVNWAMIGVLTPIAALLVGVALLAFDERARRKFASKEDICKPDGTAKFLRKDDFEGFSKRMDKTLTEIERKIEMNTGLYVKLEDRTGDLEGKVILLEERQTQQWLRISDQMAATAVTMKEITRELKQISESHQQYALRLERLQGHNHES